MSQFNLETQFTMIKENWQQTMSLFQSNLAHHFSSIQAYQMIPNQIYDKKSKDLQQTK